MIDIKTEKYFRSVAVQTGDPLDKISNFYKTEFDRLGWKTKATLATAEMTIFKATKDTRELVVNIIGDDKQRTIHQQLTEIKQKPLRADPAPLRKNGRRPR